jgi:hypothetical protein
MEADQDRDGKISFEEFTKMVENTDISTNMTLGRFLSSLDIVQFAYFSSWRYLLGSGLRLMITKNSKCALESRRMFLRIAMNAVYLSNDTPWLWHLWSLTRSGEFFNANTNGINQNAIIE